MNELMNGWMMVMIVLVRTMGEWTEVMDKEVDGDSATW